MSTGAVIVLLVVAVGYTALHLGALHALKRGLPWLAERFDRWTGW